LSYTKILGRREKQTCKTALFAIDLKTTVSKQSQSQHSETPRTSSISCQTIGNLCDIDFEGREHGFIEIHYVT
jgi:hypothetical protein